MEMALEYLMIQTSKRRRKQNELKKELNKPRSSSRGKTIITATMFDEYVRRMNEDGNNSR